VKALRKMDKVHENIAENLKETSKSLDVAAVIITV